MYNVCFYAFILGIFSTKTYYDLFKFDGLLDYLGGAIGLGVLIFFVFGGIKDLKREQEFKIDMIRREKDIEIKRLKKGKEPFSVGNRVFYLTPEEVEAHKKWGDFYFFKNSKKTGILPDEVYSNIVFNGILEHKKNEEILSDLINWTEYTED